MLLLIGASEHVKQADQSWGAPTGGAEWEDEKAGEAIAKADEADPAAAAPFVPVTDETSPPVDSTPVEETNGATAIAPAAEPEPEDHSKSYADYLAEQAEKKLQLNAGPLEPRKPNEGSKQDKKWATAKPLSKDDEEEDYIAGKAEKARRERQRKEKTRVDVDMRYVEPSFGGRGGDRGRGRGGRGEGRGGERGRGGRGRGDGYRGRGDGEYRGGGGFRGGRGGRDNTSSVNVADTSAFPSLGGS